jgi:hypothetical protein
MTADLFDNFRRETEQYRYHPWSYVFPNGQRASVIVAHRTPFRFEIQADERVTAPGGILAGLTSQQVEAKLAEVAILPANDNQP